MNKKTIGRVVKYLKPYIPLIIISLMAAAATTLLSLYVPILAGKAIDLIIAPGIVDLDGISKILIRMIMVILLAALFQWIMNVINNHITYRVVKDIRKKAFDHIQSLPLSYLDTKQYGDFVSRIIADIDQFSDGLLMGFSQFFNLKDTTEEAIEYLRHDEGASQGPVFPKMLVCPSCGKNIQAAHAGRFRCTNCKAIITISEAGAITLG